MTGGFRIDDARWTTDHGLPSESVATLAVHESANHRALSFVTVGAPVPSRETNLVLYRDQVEDLRDHLNAWLEETRPHLPTALGSVIRSKMGLLYTLVSRDGTIFGPDDGSDQTIWLDVEGGWERRHRLEEFGFEVLLDAGEGKSK